MAIPVGATARVGHTVTRDDTATAFGSGDVAVLATPRVVALVERATVEAISNHLAEGTTSVGSQVELRHLAATPVGRTVVAEATLVEVGGKTLIFDVTLSDGDVVAAAGRVWRVVVDRDRFLLRAGG